MRVRQNSAAGSLSLSLFLSLSMIASCYKLRGESEERRSSKANVEAWERGRCDSQRGDRELKWSKGLVHDLSFHAMNVFISNKTRSTWSTYIVCLFQKGEVSKICSPLKFLFRVFFVFWGD